MRTELEILTILIDQIKNCNEPYILQSKSIREEITKLTIKGLLDISEMYRLRLIMLECKPKNNMVNGIYLPTIAWGSYSINESDQGWWDYELNTKKGRDARLGYLNVLRSCFYDNPVFYDIKYQESHNIYLGKEYREIRLRSDKELLCATITTIRFNMQTTRSLNIFENIEFALKMERINRKETRKLYMLIGDNKPSVGGKFDELTKNSLWTGGNINWWDGEYLATGILGKEARLEFLTKLHDSL